MCAAVSAAVFYWPGALARKGLKMNKLSGKVQRALNLLLASILAVMMLAPASAFALDSPSEDLRPESAAEPPAAPGQPAEQPAEPPATGQPATELTTLAETYAITVGTVANGTVVADQQTAAQDATVTLTVTAAAGYKLKPGSITVLTDSQKAPRVVRGDGTDASPFTFKMPADSVTVTAEFTLICSITIAQGIEHGSVETDIQSGVVGERVTVTLKPDAGYRLKFNSSLNNPNKSLKATYGENNANVNIADTFYDPETGVYTQLNLEATKYYFTMPNGNVTITAEFTLEYQVKVAETVENGGVNPNNITVAGEGERVSAWGVADAGYKEVADSFLVVDADGVAVAYNTVYREFLMPASDVTLSAQFEELPKLEPEVVNFQATASDAEIVCTWNSLGQWKNYQVLYRVKGSTDAHKSSYFYNTLTGTVAGLINGTEYELYLMVDGAVSETVYATPQAIEPTSVVLNRSNATVVLGETVQLYAEVMPNASKSKNVTWSSSNEDVATVGIHGMVETKALGDAVITVKTDVGGKLAVCVLSVVESTAHPSDGSMIIGSTSAQYDSSGGTATVPFTVIVPTNRPIFEADFSFGVGTASSAVYSITGISLEGTALSGSSTTEVGDSKVKINALPLTVSDYYAWGVITPKAGRFLEAGKIYEFTLTIAIKGNAPPVIPIYFSNAMNYAATFYYYDYDYSPNRDRFTQPREKISGQINATWMDQDVPFTGSGTSKTYCLSTADHLLWYANQINTGAETARAALYADIDLTGTSFDGIGTAEHPYDSMFNGSNYSVTYNLNQDSNGAVGFFRYVSNGIITNLTTKGSINVTAGTVNAGGIVGEISGGTGAVGNCVNEVDVTVSGSAGGYVGGVVGYVVSSSSRFAGAAGDCINLGTVNASGTGVLAAGGIAGYFSNTVISGSANGGENRSEGASSLGSVTGRGYVGGIVGLFECTVANKNISDCTNHATVTGLAGAATGGVAGKVVFAQVGGTYNGADRTQYPNRNHGAVNGDTTYVAGIVAWLDDSDSQRAALNFNAGAVSSSSTESGAVVAGIIGRVTGSSTLIIADNINVGAISGGVNATKGGVLGKTDAELSVGLCVGNWYAEQAGLGDAAFAQTALASWLSVNGWAPQYSGTGGDGSKDSPYQLANIYDFIWFTKQVNSASELESAPGRNYNVILVTDIDLSDYPAYEGIGTDSYPRQSYNGVFDGNGHTINVALDGTTTGGQALGGNMAIFRRCGNATIKNLTVTGTVRGRNVAGVALEFGGILENVHNYADITGIDGNAAGVMLNGGPSLIKNVTNHGTISGQNAAGIAMTILVACVVEDCVNYGDVTGQMLAAGVIGTVGAGAKSTDGIPSVIIRNTRNEGTVTSLAPAVLDNVAWYNNADPSTNHTAGGIVGKIDNVIVEMNGVTNNGLVQGSGNNIGGILGTSTFGDYQDTDFRIINSTNNGDVVSTYNGDDPWFLSHINIGGIVGNTSGTFDPSSPQNPYGTPGHTQKATIIGCVNNGNVIGPDGTNIGAIGGLVTGNPDAGSVINIDNNYTTRPVDNGGRNPIDGTYYDPETQEIVDGKVVDKQPPAPEPPDPGDPEDPEQPGGPEEPGDPGDPGDPGNPSDPGNPNPGDNNQPDSPNPDSGQNTDTSEAVTLPGIISIEPLANENQNVEDRSQPIDNRPAPSDPPAAPETPNSTPDAVPEPSTALTASEVSLTPIPLGLGFDTVANTVLTLTVGFVALAILILGGFVFYRQYRRRIG